MQTWHDGHPGPSGSPVCSCRASALDIHGPDGLHMDLSPQDRQVQRGLDTTGLMRKAGAVLWHVSMRGCPFPCAGWLAPQAVYSSLHVESAETFKKQDKEWILGQVRHKHGSCEAFDTKLKLQV